MPFTLTMPKLSPTMEEGTIAKWHKKEGDHIDVGDLIMEVATDKATVEFNALDSGWLRKRLVEEGKDAVVNQPIAILTEAKDENINGYKPEGTAPAAAPKPEPKAEVKAETAPTAAPSRSQTVQQPVFAAEPPLENYQFDAPTQMENRLLASPAARKQARDQGLDITTVKGTGPSGRIMLRDLERAQPSGTVAFGHRETPATKPGTFELEPLNQIRKVISQRLQEAKTYIPHFYTTVTINAEPLSATRDQLRNATVKLTVNDFVVRACALALREHPNVNSGFDSAHNAMIRFKTIDLCVAVSVEGGLITPIVRHADFKNLGEISVEVKQLAKRAKEGKLEAHEYKGGSFTISNLGMFDVTEFAAIINPPQAALLAVSSILDVPVVRNGAVVPGKTMNLTLSSDHRVVDGVAAAQFLQTLRKYLENPAILLV